MEKLNKLNKIFNRIYYNLFIESFNGKIQNNFPKDYYRWDLVNYLIEKKITRIILKLVVIKISFFQKLKLIIKLELILKVVAILEKLVMFFFQRIQKNLI